MRINPKNYPIIADLESLNSMQIKVDDAFIQDEIFGKSLKGLEMIRTLLDGMLDVYKQVSRRYLMTEPFVESIKKAFPKIIKDELHLKHKKPDCGIIYVNGSIVLYLANPQDEKTKLALFGFNRECLTSFGAIMIDPENPDEYIYTGRFYEITEDGKTKNNPHNLNAWLESIAVSLYFIDNCEIETKVVAANTKSKFMGEKYLNETKSSFTLLNCSWLTELIRTTPFSVNGHLRWQPCGEKNSNRKLIWIEGFEKHGYVRKAQKQTN